MTYHPDEPIRRPRGTSYNPRREDTRQDDNEVLLEQVARQRRACWRQGYRPVAVYTPGAEIDGKPVGGAGKRPIWDWINLGRRTPPDAATRRPSLLSLNTAILTGEVSVFDVDVLIPEVTEQIVDLIERERGPTLLHRIGRAPKRALWYRADLPFRKLRTPTYSMPDGSKAHVEVLGDGQCAVAFGIHPDTLQPYTWTKASPCDIALTDLPVVSEGEARELIDGADAILRDAGGVIVAKDARAGRAERAARSDGDERSPGGGEGFFRAVKSAALANIGAWVTALHPGFRDRGNSGWRLSSRDLGRDREEDISVHPRGIWDFGDEEPLTAIDLVIKLGAADDAVAAALWLCQRLRIDPANLGWHERGGERQGQHGDDEQADIPLLLDVTQRPMPPPRQFLYGTEFCRKFLSLLIGIGKVGKTSLRIAQGMSVASGENLLRHGANDDRVHIRGRVLYMTFEDDAEELDRRCWAVRKHYQIADSELAGWFFPWAPEEKLVAEKDGTIKPGALATVLRGVIAKHQIDLVIFDPLIQVYEGDISENDNARMNAVVNIIIKLASELDIAVDILRHDRKGSHDPGDPDRGRGAGAVNDRGRLVRTLTHMSKEEAKKYGIGEVERRSLVRYDDAAVSFAATQEARWFRLIGVAIGNPDAVFTNGDTVQCIVPCDAPRGLGDLPDDVTEVILRELDNGLADGRRYSPHHSAAEERQAWKIVSKHADRTKEQAKATINDWVKEGLLRSVGTHDPGQRKERGGLYVNWDIWNEQKSG